MFQHFGWLFLPGTLKNIPCCLNELLVNFREDYSGIGRFRRLEVPMDGQLAQFHFLDRNRVNSPSFRFFIEAGPGGHPLEIESLQNRPIPLDSSRKLTNRSLRQRGTSFNVPGRRSLRKLSKNHVSDSDPIMVALVLIVRRTDWRTDRRSCRPHNDEALAIKQ